MALTTRYGFANTPTPGNPTTRWTSVSSGGASGASTVTVGSVANFPTSVEFDIIIGDLQTDGTLDNAERVHVLSVAGTVLTIQGTFSLTHAAGEDVYHELTAAGLQNSPGAMTDTGDTPYLGSDGRMKRLGIGGAGQLLYVSGGVPAWSGTMFTWNPADQVAETPNLQLFSSSSGTQGYLMEVDSTSTAAGSTANYPRMFHSVFNMNGTGTVTGKRVMPASLEVYNNTTGTITWSSSAEVYAENIGNGNWTTMLGIGSRLFNDGSGTVGRMVAFCTSEADHFQNGNYGAGTVSYYAAFESSGLNNSGTYGDVYGIRLMDQSAITTTGNNHAINYNDIFVVKSTGYIYNAINSSKVNDYNGTDYAAPVLAGAGAGNVSNGAHRYKFTLENNAGTIHTAGGAATAAVTVVNNAVNGKVTVTVPAQCLSPQTVAYVRIYRDKNNDGVYKLVGTAGACFRTYTDNVADGSLGAVIPTTNNTEEPVLFFSNASVGNAANSELQYNHHVPLYNPPNPGHSSDEFTYYYIFPQDRLTTDTPHMGILLQGNFNSATATVYETEGGKLALQGGAEATGGYAFIAGGAAFAGTDGGDALEGGSVTCYGSTATDAGRIEIISGVAFAAAASNLNGGNITIRSGAPANAGHYGDLTMDLWRNVTLSGSGTTAIAGGTITLNGKAISLSGNFTTSGAFNPTFAITSSSTWTFPSGGGTLLVSTSTIPLTVGTTTIASGVSGRVLYDNAGVLGEMTTTGSGTVLALATSPTLVTPILGTPTSGNLSNCTAFPLAQLTGAGAGVLTFLATPSSANLASAITDETGTAGNLVFSTAPSLTGPVTITEAVGSSALTLTGATQTSSFPVLNMTQTWNNVATTFTAVKLNVANTNSAAASLFADFQLSNTSKATITKNGSVLGAVDTGGSAAAVGVGIAANRGLWSSGSTFVDVASSGNTVMSLDGANATILVPANAALGFGGSNMGSSSVGSSVSVALYRDAAQTLAQRNSTNAQIFNIYNTYTSSTNNEYANLLWTGNVLHIGTNKGSGGGTARVLQIDYGGTTTSALSVPITSGVLTVAGGITDAGSHIVESGTAIPAGGTAAKGYMFSSTANYGIFFGSGAPTLSAAKGSLYLRSNGSGTTDRAYINTDGGTTWTAITTSA